MARLPFHVFLLLLLFHSAAPWAPPPPSPPFSMSVPGPPVRHGVAGPNLTLTPYPHATVWNAPTYCIAVSKAFAISPVVAALYRAVLSVPASSVLGNRTVVLPGRMGVDAARFKVVLLENGGRTATGCACTHAGWGAPGEAELRRALDDLYGAMVEEKSGAGRARGVAALEGRVLRVYAGIAIAKKARSGARELPLDADGEGGDDDGLDEAGFRGAEVSVDRVRAVADESACVSFARAEPVRWVEKEFAWLGGGYRPRADCLLDNTDRVTGIRVHCSLCCNGCARNGTCCGEGKSRQECGVCEQC